MPLVFLLDVAWLWEDFPMLFFILFFVWYILFENVKYRWLGFAGIVLVLSYYATYGLDYAAAFQGNFLWVLKPVLEWFGFH